MFRLTKGQLSAILLGSATWIRNSTCRQSLKNMGHNMARGLSDQFLESFKEGLLSPVLKEVREEGMILDFQIRSEEVHIYYRGGKILGIKPDPSQSGYIFSFDVNYFSHSREAGIPNSKALVRTAKEVSAWLGRLPDVKRAIDRHQAQVSEKAEREFQQMISRENTYSASANQSDYFIVDIEYQTSVGLDKGKATKFDLLGIHWPAEAAKRRNAHAQRPTLALFEMKYGDKAMKGSSGMVGHLTNTLAFAQQKGAIEELREEAILLFQQKREMGLVRFGADTQPGRIVALSDNKPQFVFLMVNHPPRSTILKSVLDSEDFRQSHSALSEFMDIRFAVANFLGYGLYESCMLTLEEFMNRLESWYGTVGSA